MATNRVVLFCPGSCPCFPSSCGSQTIPIRLCRKKRLRGKPDLFRPSGLAHRNRAHKYRKNESAGRERSHQLENHDGGPHHHLCSATGLLHVVCRLSLLDSGILPRSLRSSIPSTRRSTQSASVTMRATSFLCTISARSRDVYTGDGTPTTLDESTA